MKQIFVGICLLFSVGSAWDVIAYTKSDRDQLFLTGDCSNCNLGGIRLQGVNLRGANLSGANLELADLTDADLTGANLSGADLTDADLTRANLSKANLSEAHLQRTNLTATNLYKANFGRIDLKTINRLQDESIIQMKESGDYSGVTSFYFSRDTHYLTTKSGILYELRNGESKVVLDLNNNPKFTSQDVETGLLSVVSNKNFIYISYTINGDKNHKVYLVIDEYSKTFNNVKTITQIGFTDQFHHAGTLAFDKLGKLYVSTGDGNVDGDFENHAQNLQSVRGKILRIDVSKTNPKPEIVAYGLRNPWKFSIDSTNRMFIGDCGKSTIESVYLLDDLYPTTPYNLGWPVFEGTERRKEDPLKFQDTLPPIYEYRHSSGRKPGSGNCVIGGFYLDEPEVYVVGDFIGVVRLLKKQKDEKWHAIHTQHLPTDIWSFGYDKETKQLFISSAEKIFELTILPGQINLPPQVILCRTTMPDGTMHNPGC